MFGIPRGATISARTAWELGRDWYSDRLRDDWAPKTVEVMESIFEKVGVTDAFWRLR